MKSIKEKNQSKNVMNIKLKQITKKDIKFLYKLLSERRKNENISHRKMPTFKTHEKFVLSKPYTIWYIIILNKIKIGVIYLSKQDEVGIHLKKEFQKQGIGHVALKLLIEKNPKERFLANINPKNKKSIKFFQKNGFKLIQYTYELRTDEKNEKTS